MSCEGMTAVLIVHLALLAQFSAGGAELHWQCFLKHLAPLLQLQFVTENKYLHNLNPQQSNSFDLSFIDVTIRNESQESKLLQVPQATFADSNKKCSCYCK